MAEIAELDTNPADTVLVLRREEASVLRDIGLLLLRLTLGGLLAGHGAQKLFGWFGGPGLQGTAGWLESLGLKPGKLWALGAAMSEFGGGTLTALGFFEPLGPIATMAAMVMATATAHKGKPIWVTSGGAELPVTDMAAALSLVLSGPGRFSLDKVFGIRVPRALVALAVLGEVAILILGIVNRSTSATSQTSAEEGEKVN
jgi:putative oxidoreductase